MLCFQRLQLLPEAVYSGEPFHPGPRLQDGFYCKQWLGVGWRPLRIRLAHGGLTAAGVADGVLVAPQEVADNWGPLQGHPITASCGEGIHSELRPA